MKRANPIIVIHHPCPYHGWHTVPWNATNDPDDWATTYRQAQAKTAMHRGIDQFPSARGFDYGH